MTVQPAIPPPNAHNLRTWLASRTTPVNLATALALALAAFWLYAQTLVPGVLDGDQGEFQFMPAVLGIPHPSGFPLYILLGHLWSGLPIGSLAYRMNLFSAFWGALTVGAVFLALRWQNLRWPAALAAAALLAVIPQFWQYSTAAAVYRLHNFLMVLVFAFLAQWERTREDRWLQFAALAFGFDLANHLTIVFFAPATLLLLLLSGGRWLIKRPRAILISAACLLLPLLLYLYFPIRAAQLASAPLFSGWPLNVARGIVSPFYPENSAGLVQYFFGGAFFGTITGHWQWNWDSLPADWLGTILQTINWQVALLALAGTIALFARRARLALWLVVNIILFQVIALQYSYLGLTAIGQFSSYFKEYFLPSFILMILLAGWGADAVLSLAVSLSSRLPAALNNRISRAVVPAVAFCALAIFSVVAGLDLASHHSDDLVERSREIQSKWHTIRTFPPEQGALFVGHWGDLTPLWYLQYAEGWRTDLVTVHPPEEDKPAQWLASGKPVYLAGSLLNWAPGLAQHYRLLPWGPIVQLSQKDIAPPSPLSNSATVRFEGPKPRLRLLGYDLLQKAAPVGGTIEIAAYWRALDSIALEDYVAFFSLENSEDQTKAESFPLFVNWLPGGKLANGQRALSSYDLSIPWGTPPGTYSVRLDVYSLRAGDSLTPTGTDGQEPETLLGTIQVQPPAVYPDTVKTDHPVNANYGGKIALIGWDGEVSTVTTGDTPALDLVWKELDTSHGPLSLAFSLENHTLRREAGTATLVGKAVRGEILRGDQTFVVPADLPEGEYDLMLDVRDNGSPLQPRAVALSEDERVRLGSFRVTGRRHNYDLPAIPRTQQANFDGRIELLGYSLDKKEFRPGQSAHLSLFWQGLALMPESYKFFAHLVDADGKIVAQHDIVPGNGGAPTTAWLPHESVADSFALNVPDDATPGRYEIRVGFYNVRSLARLPVVGGASQDFVVLQDALEVTTP